jgi:MFS family permease
MIAAGLPPATAAAITGIRGIAQLTGRLPLGRILRRAGARRTLVAASILAAAAAITLLASRQLPAAIAYSLLGGASLGAISALQGIYTQQLVAAEDLGLLFGAQQAAYGAGGALGPALGGALLAVTSSFNPVIIAITAAFLASAAMLIRPLAAPPAPPGGDQPARAGPNPPQAERPAEPPERHWRARSQDPGAGYRAYLTGILRKILFCLRSTWSMRRVPARAGARGAGDGLKILV